MAKFVDAYDTRTGKKLNHSVPAAWIGHPVLGVHLSETPRSKSERVNPMTTTETPGRRGKKKETRHAEDSR